MRFERGIASYDIQEKNTVRPLNFQILQQLSFQLDEGSLHYL